MIKHTLKVKISGIYLIVDNSLVPQISYNKIAEDAIKGGIKIIQLRIKINSSKEFLQIAKQLRMLCSEMEVIYIVNDRIDIALLSNADGVHLGQDDLPINGARKIMGNEKIIGISTHNLEQALKAEREGADYIGFGPIFETKTKDSGEIPKGLTYLKEIRDKVSIPVIAIGGIKEENILSVFESGADGVAIISAITTSSDITERTRHFCHIYNSFKKCKL